MISIFTPTHRPDHLKDCYDSLRAQTVTDWQWVIGFNNFDERQYESVIRDIGAGRDPRITWINLGQVKGVGDAKRKTCEACSGDIMVELDHDDVLRSDALEQIQRAFDDHPDIGFVYSHFAQMNADMTVSETPFSAAYGWTFQPEDFDGREITRTNTLSPTPHNCAHIWYGPNHVRAWRSELYHRIGGYDPDLEVLDDQNLMCRMFVETDFHQIDACLYLQRHHQGNTQLVPELNAQIQRVTVQMVDDHSRRMATAWAARRRLPILSFDRDDAADVFTTLSGLGNDSVGVIVADDFLQHVADSVRLLNEFHRVLTPSGLLLSTTPSTDGRGAFQDPSHVSYFSPNRFWYCSDENFAKYNPGNTARFQVSRLDSFYPSDWHEQHQIVYVRANLIAFKDGPRNGGALNWT